MAGAALGSASLLARPLSSFGAATRQGAAEFSFIQYHNQTAASFLHKRISDMWTAIRTETDGRVEGQVFPLNNKVQGATRPHSRCSSPARYSSSHSWAAS